MSHCKACDKILDNPPRRFIEEATITVEENLCPKCLDIAMRAVVNRDLTDDQEYVRQFGSWVNDPPQAE